MMELDRLAAEQHCEELQAEFLANRALIIAANRAPVTLERDEDGAFQVQRGGGGLVTALTDLCCHAKDATWIDSHAIGKAYATGMALRALKRLHDLRTAQ